jgi:hypothetical protein
LLRALQSSADSVGTRILACDAKRIFVAAARAKFGKN